jgi:lysozyme
VSIDQSQQVAQAYSWLRALSGGKLSVEQVIAGDQIIAANGLSIFAQSIGFTLPSLTVTGQWDISEKGYALIRDMEGFRGEAYLDTGGVWTIGFGTIKYPDGSRVRKGDVCTRGQAEVWLKNDSAWVDACLDRSIKTKISQNQFDALASFVYNIGETAFNKSTMLILINQKNFKDASNQFDRWVFDNGKRIQGLVNRRDKEKAMYLS